MDDKEYEPLDRRPIATRDRALIQRVASRIAATGMSANTISVIGMLAGIAAGALFALTATQDGGGSVRLLWAGGALLVQVRLLANLFDGMVAVETGTASPVGELYNEVPDRVSDVAIFVGLGFAASSSPWLGFAAAIAALFVAYARSMAKVAGAPQDYCGPMAKQHRMFLVTLAGIAGLCIEPMPQLLVCGVLVVIVAGCLFTAARRLSRASHHLHQSSSS